MSAALRRRLQHTGDLAKAFPRVHFVGIGGVGMSGIAEVMCTLGYQVSGSDNADNAVTRRLSSLGVDVRRGHAAANVLGTDCVVVSSAIRADNPELMEAHAQSIPVVPRAEMLAAIPECNRSRPADGTIIAGITMKILLQHARTQLYLRSLGNWTADPSRAYNFQHSQRAIEFAQAHTVIGVQLVVKFDDSDFEEVMPMPMRLTGTTRAFV